MTELEIVGIAQAAMYANGAELMSDKEMRIIEIE